MIRIAALLLVLLPRLALGEPALLPQAQLDEAKKNAQAARSRVLTVDPDIGRSPQTRADQRSAAALAKGGTPQERAAAVFSAGAGAGPQLCLSTSQTRALTLYLQGAGVELSNLVEIVTAAEQQKQAIADAVAQAKAEMGAKPPAAAAPEVPKPATEPTAPTAAEPAAPAKVR